MRGIQYAAAPRFHHRRLWDTGSPAGACHRAAIRPTRWRVTTTECGFAFSRRNAPELCQKFPCPPNKGRRECRMRAAPAISCAMCTEECAHEHTGQRRTSDIPCAMALRLITSSPRRTALLPPSLAGLTTNLTPAPRHQDHTSLPYALMPLVFGTTSVHRNPSLVGNDGRRPLEWDGMDMV